MKIVHFLRGISAAALFAAAVLPAAGAEESSGSKMFGFDIAISSGGFIYEGAAKDSSAQVVDTGNYHRIIVGTGIDIYVSPVQPIRFFTGMDLMSDFIWNGDLYSNHLDYSFLFGVKAYPTPTGFSISVAYALGQRADFYNTVTDTSGKIPGTADAVARSASAWGNGFRLGLEYDFGYGKNKVLPAVGGYLRCMPRGEKNYDVMLALYIALGF